MTTVAWWRAGRTVSLKGHDDAYYQAPSTLRRLAVIPGVSVTVVDRDGRCLFPGEHPSVLSALYAGRTIPTDRIPALADSYATTRAVLMKHPPGDQRDKMLAVLGAGQADLDRAARRRGHSGGLAGRHQQSGPRQSRYRRPDPGPQPLP